MKTEGIFLALSPVYWEIPKQVIQAENKWHKRVIQIHMKTQKLLVKVII